MCATTQVASEKPEEITNDIEPRGDDAKSEYILPQETARRYVILNMNADGHYRIMQNIEFAIEFSMNGLKESCMSAAECDGKIGTPIIRKFSQQKTARHMLPTACRSNLSALCRLKKILVLSNPTMPSDLTSLIARSSQKLGRNKNTLNQDYPVRKPPRC